MKRLQNIYKQIILVLFGFLFAGSVFFIFLERKNIISIFTNNYLRSFVGIDYILRAIAVTILSLVVNLVISYKKFLKEKIVNKFKLWAISVLLSFVTNCMFWCGVYLCFHHLLNIKSYANVFEFYFMCLIAFSLIVLLNLERITKLVKKGKSTHFFKLSQFIKVFCFSIIFIPIAFVEKRIYEFNFLIGLVSIAIGLLFGYVGLFIYQVLAKRYN